MAMHAEAEHHSETDLGSNFDVDLDFVLEPKTTKGYLITWQVNVGSDWNPTWKDFVPTENIAVESGYKAALAEVILDDRYGDDKLQWRIHFGTMRQTNLVTHTERRIRRVVIVKE